MKIRIDTNTILLVFVIGLFLYVNRNHNRSREKPDTVIIQDNRDDLDREIIREPKRFYDSKYHSRRQMAVNVPTRGEAPSYQQVGYLGDVSDTENIKPLYGRQTYALICVLSEVLPNAHKTSFPCCLIYLNESFVSVFT